MFRGIGVRHGPDHSRSAPREPFHDPGGGVPTFMRAMADLVRSLMRARTVGSAIAAFVKMTLPNRPCGSLQVFWRSSHGELPSQTDIRSLSIFCADAEHPDRIIILFVLHLAV